MSKQAEIYFLLHNIVTCISICIMVISIISVIIYEIYKYIKNKKGK